MYVTVQETVGLNEVTAPTALTWTGVGRKVVYPLYPLNGLDPAVLLAWIAQAWVPVGTGMSVRIEPVPVPEGTPAEVAVYQDEVVKVRLRPFDTMIW